jgi:hypothetical protein
MQIHNVDENEESEKMYVPTLQSKMLPYLYVFPTKEEETQKYEDCLTGYISQILEHIYGASSAKLICICGISFYIYRLSKTGSKIVGMEKYTKKSKYI